MLEVNNKNFLEKKLIYKSFSSGYCIITGGHFMIDENYKPVLNDGTIKSFLLAAELYKKRREKKLSSRIGILINDIGFACGDQSLCVLKQNYFLRKNFKLPKEYVDIMKKQEIDKNDLVIFWEKHIRNRGKKEFLKQLKGGNKNIKAINGDYWLLDKDYGRILLTRKRNKDKYGNAACPLIMGALHKEQERKGATESINFYYVGENNKRNIPNHYVIEKGKKVLEKFNGKINIKNIYFSK